MTDYESPDLETSEDTLAHWDRMLADPSGDAAKYDSGIVCRALCKTFPNRRAEFQRGLAKIRAVQGGQEECDPADHA